MLSKEEWSETKAKFTLISSTMGSIEAQPCAQPCLGRDATPYAISNAGYNLLARKIHFEHEEFGVFAVHPSGWRGYGGLIGGTYEGEDDRAADLEEGGAGDCDIGGWGDGEGDEWRVWSCKGVTI
jgi:hypothetical protein